METITFTKQPKSKQAKKSQQIRVPIDVYQQLNQLSEETGIVLSKIAAKLFRAVLPYVELIEAPFTDDEDEEDDE